MKVSVRDGGRVTSGAGASGGGGGYFANILLISHLYGHGQIQADPCSSMYSSIIQGWLTDRPRLPIPVVEPHRLMARLVQASTSPLISTRIPPRTVALLKAATWRLLPLYGRLAIS